MCSRLSGINRLQWVWISWNWMLLITFRNERLSFIWMNLIYCSLIPCSGIYFGSHLKNHDRNKMNTTYVNLYFLFKKSVIDFQCTTDLISYLILFPYNYRLRIPSCFFKSYWLFISVNRNVACSQGFLFLCNWEML